MTPHVIIIALFGLLAYAKDAVVWGAAGHLVFRRVGGRDQRWWPGALGLAVAYFVYHEVIMGAVMRAIKMQIGDSSVATLIGDDLWRISVSDVVIAVVVPTAGFLLARRLFRGIGAGRNPITVEAA